MSRSGKSLGSRYLRWKWVKPAESTLKGSTGLQFLRVDGEGVKAALKVASLENAAVCNINNSWNK